MKRVAKTNIRSEIKKATTPKTSLKSNHTATSKTNTKAKSLTVGSKQPVSSARIVKDKSRQLGINSKKSPMITNSASTLNSKSPKNCQTMVSSTKLTTNEKISSMKIIASPTKTIKKNSKLNETSINSAISPARSNISDFSSLKSRENFRPASPSYFVSPTTGINNRLPIKVLPLGEKTSKLKVVSNYLEISPARSNISDSSSLKPRRNPISPCPSYFVSPTLKINNGLLNNKSPITVLPFGITERRVAPGLSIRNYGDCTDYNMAAYCPNDEEYQLNPWC